MNNRCGCIVVGLLLAAGPGLAQNRLGEVAGSIKLNPEAIVQKDGYVDDGTSARKEDRELYGNILADCTAAADRLASLMEETKTTMIYRGSELPDQLRAVSLELDSQLADLELLRLGDVFSESLQSARSAIEPCSAGTDAVREELGRKGLAFTVARDEISRCRGDFHRAQALLEAIDATGEEAPAEDADNAAPITDEAMVEAACQSGGERSPEEVEACEGRQYRALAALGSRTSENEHLDPGIFEEIREFCNRLNPSDFEARNVCEIERMTAARLEGE